MQERTKTLKEMAEEELQYIEKAIAKTREELKGAPEGKLNISYVRGSTQYYYKYDKTGKKSYLPKENQEFIRALAQKEYNIILLKTLEEKKAALKRFQEHYPDESIDCVYDRLHPRRKELVTPIRPTDEQYVKAWLEKPYNGRGFGADEVSCYITDRQERVRSKSEVIIANTLLRMGLPYRYEYPLRLGTRTYYPDFTILDIRTREEVYFEHFGMMDNPGYVIQALSKLNLYIRCGMMPGREMIMTFESQKVSLDINTLHSVLKYRFF